VLIIVKSTLELKEAAVCKRLRRPMEKFQQFKAQLFPFSIPGLDEVLIITKSKLELEKEAAAAARGPPSPQQPRPRSSGGGPGDDPTAVAAAERARAAREAAAAAHVLRFAPALPKQQASLLALLRPLWLTSISAKLAHWTAAMHISRLGPLVHKRDASARRVVHPT